MNDIVNAGNESLSEKTAPGLRVWGGLARLGIGVVRVSGLFCLFACCSSWMGERATGDMPQTQQSIPVDRLLNNLNDPLYRVRREAFVQLCDNNFAIDDFLKAESASTDFNRSRVAAWLIKLRKSPGDASRKFEMLSDYQAMLAGDKSPLFQRIVDGRWNEVLELLRTVPQEAMQDLLERETQKNMLESRFVDRLIDQAWRSGNEWAVPQIVDIFAPNENRVGINRWWREIGMPEEWRISEPIDPKITIMRLASEGKYDEALKLASEGRLRTEYDRVAIESGNWEALIRGSANNSMIPSSGLKSKMKLWALAFANDDVEQSEKLWSEIKKLPGAGMRGGQATMALVMNDQPYFDEIVDELSELDAFMVLYYSGRVEEAFRRVGLDELTPVALEAWLKTRSSLFDRDEATNSMYIERDLASLFSSAFHNLGVPGMEQKFDKFWMDLVASKIAADGPGAMLPILSTWKLYNQRDKAVRYLTEYAKKNVVSVAIWLKASSSPSDMDQRRLEFASCIDKLYANNLYSPVSILQHLFSSQKQGSPSEKIEAAFRILDDLYAGRKPAGWDSKRELLELKKSLQLHMVGEAELAKSIAELLDLFGETSAAFGILQESVSLAAGSSEEFFWVTAALQEKLGFPKAAGDTMLQIVDSSTNLETLVRTVDVLEKTGRYADLDRLRYRWLSCVSRENQPTISFFIDDSDLYDRPEVELLYDRWEAVAGSVDQSYSEIRYRLAKKDLAKAPKAKRAALQSFLDLAPSLVLRDDSRPTIQSLIGPFALESVYRKDKKAVAKWLNVAVRLEPGQIQIPIDIIPHADKYFEKETVDEWFDLFWNKMHEQIETFPNDAMSLNNVAWMASQCNRRLNEAVVLSRRAVELRPDPTYMDTLADLEFRLGNVEKSIELSTKCRNMEPREEQHKKQLLRFYGSLNPN